MRLSSLIIFVLVIALIQSVAINSVIAQSSSGAPVKVELSVSSDKVFVDESFVLFVRVEYTSHFSDVNVQTPRFPDLVEFQKLSGTQSSKSHNIVYNSMTNQYDVRSTFEFARQYKALQVGKYEISPIEVTIIDPEHTGGQLKIRTNPVSIEVVELTGTSPSLESSEEPEDIRDIKSPIAPPNWILYVAGAGGLLILFAISMLITKLVQSHERPDFIKTPQRIVNPYERAKEKLGNLKIPDASDDDAVAVFYVRLSDIVKEYLAAKHAVVGFEATSLEITTAMRDIYLDFDRGQELIGSLEIFLQEIDLAKYAKAHRDANFMVNAVEKANEFIDLDDTITREIEKTAEDVDIPQKE